MKTGAGNNVVDTPSDSSALDRIDRYVLGHMEPEECASFETELSSDPDLAEQVCVRRMAIAAIIDRETLKDDFMEIEARIGRRRRNPVLVTFVTVAAAACIAAGVFFRTSSVNACRTAGASVLLAELPPTRGGVDFQSIAEAIDEERYDEAFRLINSCRSEPAPEYDLNTEEGRYKYELYISDMQTLDYLEAVSLLRQGKPVKARRLLKSISADNTSFWSANAADLLDMI